MNRESPLLTKEPALAQHRCITSAHHLHGICNWMEVAHEFSRRGACIVTELIDMVTSDSPETLPALWALGEIGDRRAVPYLMRILGNGSSSCIRAIAAVSLLKLNDPEGIRMVRLCYGGNENR